MKLLRLLLAVALMTAVTSVPAADGLVATKSPYAVRDTLDRFEANAHQRGLKTFAHIDHTAGAASVGKTLRPTEVLIFGGPQGGTPFMECAQNVGIDLPLKVLAWEDATGQVWLGYNDPAWIARRHEAVDCPAVAPLTKALSSLVEKTVAK